MATAPHPLSEAELERIYAKRIRPDVLDGIEPSQAPTAVLVAGQPGSGRSDALRQVSAHLARTGGPSAVVSGEALRQHHPAWRLHGHDAAGVSDDVRSAVGQWVARVSADAITRRVNVLFETSLRQAEAAVALATLLRQATYHVAAVVLATDRDQSRQATMAYYDLAHRAGAAPAWVTASDHDGAYDALRDTLGRLESEQAVDRLQIIARDGRQLYANELSGGTWLRPPKAVAVLDDFRERRLTARELADSALRWQTLVQRLALDPAVPREVASQLLAWRNESTGKAEHDPEAARLLEWGRDAEAFRTLNRTQFLSEFPHHAKAVERLDQAMRYAQQNFALAADRTRFIDQTRDRLAERIAEGRVGARDRSPPERAPKTR